MGFRIDLKLCSKIFFLPLVSGLGCPRIWVLVFLCLFARMYSVESTPTSLMCELIFPRRVSSASIKGGGPFLFRVNTYVSSEKCSRVASSVTVATPPRRLRDASASHQTQARASPTQPFRDPISSRTSEKYGAHLLRGWSGKCGPPASSPLPNYSPNALRGVARRGRAWRGVAGRARVQRRRGGGSALKSPRNGGKR